MPLRWAGDHASSPELVLGEPNEAAWRYLSQPASWQHPVALLYGPASSGKSLIAAHVHAAGWAQSLDDADRVPEQDVFHAWNEAVAQRSHLLITTSRKPAEWSVTLPDLRSRLLGVPMLSILPPGEGFAYALASALFERRHLVVQDDAIRYLARHVDRSHSAIVRAVTLLDQEALARQRAITVRMITDLLNSSRSLALEDPLS